MIDATPQTQDQINHLAEIDWSTARLSATMPGSRPNRLPVVHNRQQALAVAFSDDLIAEAFWAKVDRSGGSFSWWPWKGATPDGYGHHSLKFTGGYRLALNAHKFAYEMVNGPCQAPALDHLCRNRSCCNPRHLDPVTQQINTLRGVSPAAANAQKTHCKKGHPLEGENVILVQTKAKLPSRKCRTCTNATYAAYRARRALEKEAGR